MILSLLRGGTNDPATRGGMGSSDYSRNTRRLALILFVALVLVGVFQAITPDPFRHYFVDVVLTRSLIFGVAAASIVFLSAFGGMISLGQTLMYGVCAFTVGNAVTTGGSKGLNLGWNPWVGVLLGIGVTTALGFLMGLLASRSSGLYYLMITLAYGVIGYYFFVQVTVLSGFGGVNQVGAPRLHRRAHHHHQPGAPVLHLLGGGGGGVPAVALRVPHAVRVGPARGA